MKAWFNFGKYTMFIGAFIFWIDTIVFLIFEGWHLRSTNSYEILFDLVSSFLLSSGVIIMLMVMIIRTDKKLNA